MRKIFRLLLLKPVLWASAKFSSKPDREKIFTALTRLSGDILKEPGKKGLVIPFEYHAGKFIIFSDQHKGTRNGADDFKQAETNYLAALNYYSDNDFCFINLGDSEELWENSIRKVKKKNRLTFEAEKKFLAHNNYVKIFGNHDLYWDTSPLSWWHLKSMFGEVLKVYEGAILKTLVGEQELTIFLTHGHQGDGQSDGNWFSKFFVAYIWAPLQGLLRINPNTPAYNAEKKTLHNSIMYEWASQQKDMLLVTGHTHQPVFTSLTHLERLYKQLQLAEKVQDEKKIKEVRSEILIREKEFTAVAVDYMTMKPSYFNTGCCCFSDGDITGIEIEDGCIRLIKWSSTKREALEKISLEELAGQL
ncbi:MAG TPA: metallophosphoesterase [Chitinophagaceae bacterium]|nr:metallophosphoesterase [Chitinophagaceae bacterium]